MNNEGLTHEEAQKRLERYGRNEIAAAEKMGLFSKILSVIKEPMFLLLLAAAVIYFILGEPRDGAVMLIFVAGVISIEFIQEWKTDKTLDALRELSAPRVAVVRDGKEIKIPSAEVVPGDVMLLCEGEKVSADGVIIRANNLKTDESTLTGESVHVWKTPEEDESGGAWKKNRCYAGTLVTQGTGAVLVDATGANTEYGKIGAAINEAPDRPTPLEKQIARLVKMCAFIAGGLFLAVCVITFINLSGTGSTSIIEGGCVRLSMWERVTQSILAGITLAMAMIPEEFPVILTVFLSMGAWRLARKKSLVRRLPSVETLGAVSVLCVDKTGTITTNKMRVSEVTAVEGDMLTVMGRACEVDAYDPMETAIIDYCRQNGAEDIFNGELVHDYPFTDEKKMMGHLWRTESGMRLFVKGSPESVLCRCDMTEDERKNALDTAAAMASRGLRVLAAACAETDAVKNGLDDYKLTLCGFVGLIDPPRDGMRENIALCKSAGIRVVMITGDSGVTARAVAESIGMEKIKVITGQELDAMSDDELRACVKTANVFSRVVPEHKMRIVKALKENGEITAMTGDGVNDAAALKYSDIGIAMGKRGSEVSREAADLILLEDDFSVIVDTVRDGRRIYDNIRKAVGYVFTIHIPIALASLIGALMGIDASALLLLPVHVVLLELVIDPTCSVVLERQPEERNIMNRPPRNADEGILTRGTVIKSVLQGLIVFMVSFLSYLYLLRTDGAECARSVGLGIILLSNLFLVQVNSSESDFAVVSALRLMHDKVMWLVNAATLAGIFIVLYTPLRGFLSLAPLSADKLLYMTAAAVCAVFWYEIVKAVKKITEKLKIS